MPTLNLNQLLQLAIEPVQRRIRTWWIDRQIAAEYRNLDHFKAQVDNGHCGISDSLKRIVNLENSKGL